MWVRLASPLWHFAREQRCSDIGDSLYLLIWVLPSLALGVICAVWGLAYTCLTRKRGEGHTRIVFWCSMVIAWCVAALGVYLLIGRELAIPC